MKAALHRWFPGAMALMAFAMFGLVTKGLIRPPVVIESPTGLFFFGTLFALFQIAILVFDRSRPPLSPEREAAMVAARHREIQQWLQRPIGRDEAIADLLHPVELRAPIEYQRATADFDQWFASAKGPNRELWLYSTDDESWENLCGERGFAIVSDGQVIDFYMTAMN